MGVYVNPQDETKEVYLEREGVEIGETDVETWFDVIWANDADHKNRLPVCLVENMMFTAAAVCYCQGEIDEFTASPIDDPRPRKWYSVPIEKLKESSNLENYMKVQNG